MKRNDLSAAAGDQHTAETSLTRRAMLKGGLSAVVCALSLPSAAATKLLDPALVQEAERIYSAIHDEPFPIPAVDLSKLNPAYFRQLVDYETDERPGTVIVDTHSRVLYLTLESDKAIRYGVGIGRDGFTWAGRGEIRFKKAWPTWTPPAEMIERQPELEEYRNGMPPGLENPLGARALYIYQGDADTLYRVHGNGDVTSIGQSVSSGCIRLLHQDVIDLYNRVPEHTPIVVI
jgi:lipoprotein-anchoring transpeptidase ErfK/SrfK